MLLDMLKMTMMNVTDSLAIPSVVFDNWIHHHQLLNHRYQQQFHHQYLRWLIIEVERLHLKVVLRFRLTITTV